MNIRSHGSRIQIEGQDTGIGQFSAQTKDNYLGQNKYFHGGGVQRVD